MDNLILTQIRRGLTKQCTPEYIMTQQVCHHMRPEHYLSLYSSALKINAKTSKHSLTLQCKHTASQCADRGKGWSNNHNFWDVLTTLILMNALRSNTIYNWIINDMVLVLKGLILICNFFEHNLWISSFLIP